MDVLRFPPSAPLRQNVAKGKGFESRADILSQSENREIRTTLVNVRVTELRRMETEVQRKVQREFVYNNFRF